MEPKKVKNKVSFRFNDEILEKLDEISKTKYRGVDRTKAIGWLIEDKWEELKENTNGTKTIGG